VCGHPALFAGPFGLLTGIATSLLAALAIITYLHSWELWELISKRHSGGYITAILFWVFLGIMVLGRSLG
jgi:hypothetical protein